MLVNGKWTQDWQPVQATDAKGGFVRQVSGFETGSPRTEPPAQPANPVSRPRRGATTFMSRSSAPGPHARSPRGNSRS